MAITVHHEPEMSQFSSARLPAPAREASVIR
jgi:hypothetical protein